MRQVGIYTDRVSYWKNRDQRQRWVGTALQEIEPKLRTVRGYPYLKELREAMKNLNFKENIRHCSVSTDNRTTPYWTTLHKRK